MSEVTNTNLYFVLVFTLTIDGHNRPQTCQQNGFLDQQKLQTTKINGIFVKITKLNDL